MYSEVNIRKKYYKQAINFYSSFLEKGFDVVSLSLLEEYKKDYLCFIEDCKDEDFRELFEDIISSFEEEDPSVGVYPYTNIPDFLEDCMAEGMFIKFYHFELLGKTDVVIIHKKTGKVYRFYLKEYKTPIRVVDYKWNLVKVGWYKKG